MEWDPMAINGRRRDENGEISRKHRNILIGALRKLMVQHRCGQPRLRISDVLQKIDEH